MLFIVLVTIVASVVSASGKFWVITAHSPIVVEQVFTQRGDIVRNNELLLVARRASGYTMFTDMDKSLMEAKVPNGSKSALMQMKDPNESDSAPMRMKAPDGLENGTYMVREVMVSEGQRYEEGAQVMILELVSFCGRRSSPFLHAKL
ncbi:hypothetical protein PSACC_01083 [Paramicrosporidium saccamoebae]|uniref:Uncharacterized protein n=1 Tax=Paramicrosporidium saccamoebae TaxID=1246581 RepID=A0A2H9TMX0_9FUNG|nr:hypothetical protein PSACC_01083 [Paramicrosporidium saccamoebae]